MRDLTGTPSVDALRALFFASARAEQAARENRYRGSGQHLGLLIAINDVHPCAELEAAIDTLRDTLEASKVSFFPTTNEE